MKKIIVILAILLFSGRVFAAEQAESDLMSLDLKGMEIRDVLKILSQKSGLNIVADSEVDAAVTLYLKDVTVMDVINIIASTNKLAYEQTGTLLRLMNEKDYEKVHGKGFEDRTRTEVVKLNYARALDAGKAVSQMKSEIGKIISDDVSGTIVMIDSPDNIKRMKQVISEMDVPLVTQIFPLDYANAESIKEKISEMVSKDAGSVKFDEKTNKLVVKDTRQRVEDIRDVIEAFDEKTREVLIDANIVQVTLSDKYSYGIDWQDIARIGDVQFTQDTNLSTGLSNVTPSTLSIITTGGNYSAIVNLLNTYGETNVLSRPRIMVIDKHEAKILVGAKEVYVTSEVTTTTGGTYHTTDNVQFVDVGVRLAVTPEINRAGFVTLKIKPEVSNADATKTVQLKNPDGSTRTVIPYVTTSEAETSVVVKDGTTIIIGGLMKDTFIDHVDKVPFLGDVPVIGRLFTAKGRSKEKTELVIFLTPHIIQGDMTTEEAQKYISEWERQSEKIEIQGQKQPEQVSPKIRPYKKSHATPGPAPKMKQKTAPSQKWTPILGAGSKNIQARDIEKQEPAPAAEKPAKATKAAKTLDAKKTPYEEYYFEIRQEINDLAKKDKDIGGIKGEVQLELTLDKEGFLVRSPVVANNPDLRLVRSAVKTVKNAVPFKRFPKGLNKDQADFSVVVRYE